MGDASPQILGGTRLPDFAVLSERVAVALTLFPYTTLFRSRKSVV